MRKYSLIFLIFIGLSSCGIYRQNVVNVPLMQQKRQTQIGAHVGFTGYDAQGSYALTNHIGIIANYNDMGTKEVVYSKVNHSVDKHNFGEFGAGYYLKNKSGWIMEFFALAGKGYSSHLVYGGDTIPGHTAPFTYLRTGNYYRFLIQADFGKSYEKFKFALTPRIFLNQYYKINDTQTDIYKHLNNTYLYADLEATVQYKLLKYLMLSGQAGLTIPVTGYNVSYYEFSPFNCSLGLILNLNFSNFSDSKKH